MAEATAAASNEVEPSVAVSTEEEFIKTTTGNYVSHKAEITEAKNVEIKGKSWIEQGVIVRGDLAKIRLGRYCKISTGTRLEPAPATPVNGSSNKKQSEEEKSGLAHVPVVIGSHTILGLNCHIRAAAIGSYCWVGNNVKLGQRVIIKDACVIDHNVVIGDDTVIPPFTHVRTMTVPTMGNNSSAGGTTETTQQKVLQMVDLPPATVQLLQEESTEVYQDFVAQHHNR